jgi:outer membrane cobalamin receptor
VYDVSAHFTPIETVKIKVGLTGMGNRNNQILLENNKVKVDPVGSVLDLHARLDYRFKEKGRIWIQGSNLLNRNYQMWYGLPNYGITVMGGISLGLF